MRPTTIRRLLVFAVCAFGVGALYWVPSLAGTPGQNPRQAEPQPVRTIRTTVTAEPTSTRTTTVTADPTGSSEPASETTTQDTSTTAGTDRTVTPAPTQRPDRSPREGSTPRDPGDQTDRTRPEPVPDVKVKEATRDHLTVTWSKADDDRGVVSYKVLLNGFEVLTTSDLRATLDWFNDDGDVNTVQVSALDAAGNQSSESPTVLASKPPAPQTPEPTPTPTPEPSPTPTPTPSPTPKPTPTPSDASSSDAGEQSGPSPEPESPEQN